MRVVIPIVLGALTALFLVRLLQPSGAGVPGPEFAPAPTLLAGERPIVAEVLEVRDASLFAGACHLASECDSQGRDALLAVTIESGVRAGVDLAGTRALLAVSAEGNLATDAVRRSELWVDGGAAQARAVAAWMSDERPGAVGELLATHRTDVVVERRGARTRVHVPGVAEIEVEAITDGSCCSMPENRLYEPLVTAASDTVVGYASHCRFEGTEALQRWRYADANNAHVGRIEAPAACVPASPCTPASTCTSPCRQPSPCGAPSVPSP